MKMSFVTEWVEKIMQCVSTVSYAVSINGKIRGFFKPTRGLRQEDPLNSFLFLICSKGLFVLMHLMFNDRLLNLVKASCNGPQISHLLFTDDCILFGITTLEGSNVLKIFWSTKLFWDNA